MRLIDADMLLNSFKGAKKLGVDAIKYYVGNTPTIDLVKCGECKHSKEWYGDHRLCYLWSETGIGVFEDGFCSYGKRREDERGNSEIRR